jgi:NAD(P)-dependent dehydrogenase (short-subunit alcohol dehydrogenase family)
VTAPSDGEAGAQSPAPPLGQRVALVTGGGRGLGRAIALALAARGHPVAVLARSGEEVEATASGVAALGGRALACACDVANAGAVTAALERVSAHLGPPLVVVNNAGAARSHTIRGHPDELWNEMLATNLTGAFQVMRAAAPAMLDAGWGRIVNVGSIASLTGARYIAAYTAAKHGLLGLTRAAAAEWALRGITVNLVAPGYLDTPLTLETVAGIASRTGRSPEEAARIVREMSPLRRLVTVGEVVPIVLLLVADDARAITGAAIPVDGGASALAGTG